MRQPRRGAQDVITTTPPRPRRGVDSTIIAPSASPQPAVRARQEAAREPIAPCTTGTTAQRHEDHTTTGGDAPRALSPTARLHPHRLFASRGTLPFGLDNAAASLARAICPNAQTYVERPMVLPCDPRAQRPTSELPDFSQVRGLRRLGLGQYTITSLRQRLLEEGRGCFYTAEPDSGSKSDSHDPTRECFHIDGAVETTDETQDAVAGGRAPAAREYPRTPGNDGHVDPPSTRRQSRANCTTTRAQGKA